MPYLFDAAVLRAARDRYDHTQDQARTAIGCSLRAFKSWEIEGAEPRRQFHKQIAAYIDAAPKPVRARRPSTRSEAREQEAGPAMGVGEMQAVGALHA